MPASTRDHIHLDTVNPPVLEWHTEEWGPTHRIFMSVGYGLTGLAQVQVLSADGSTPVQLVDMEYRVRFNTHAEYETMRAMVGKTVYLVDHWHDDESLASYIVAMAFLDMAKPEIRASGTLELLTAFIRLVDMGL